MKEPFSKLKFPAHELGPEDDALEKFPTLGKYKAFAQYKGKYKTQVIKYIILLYDMNSDLVEDYPNLRERKEEAARLAGFKITEVRGWQEPINFAINCNYDHEQGVGIYKMIFTYLRFQNSYEWQELCNLEQDYEEFSRLRSTAINDQTDDDNKILQAAERKNKLGDYSDKIISKIGAYRKTVFGDNEDVEEHTQQIRLTSPERFSKL